jgi:hypothetical protein
MCWVDFASFNTWQIDPNEKLDPEVEDVLMDIAEDFVESVSFLLLNKAYFCPLL